MGQAKLFGWLWIGFGTAFSVCTPSTEKIYLPRASGGKRGWPWGLAMGSDPVKGFSGTWHGLRYRHGKATYNSIRWGDLPRDGTWEWPAMPVS